MNEKLSRAKSSRFSVLYPLMIFSLYLFFYQTWFSLVYLLMIFLILNNELQKRYVLSKSPSNKISIKKIPNKKHIYLSLILISLGILIYKIGAFAFTVASKKTDNILLKVKPQKELEYYIDDEMIIDDIIYTLLPSCVNLLVSSFSFYIDMEYNFNWRHVILGDFNFNCRKALFPIVV